MEKENTELEKHYPADTFLALSVIFVSCFSAIFIGFYWRALVLDNFIEMDTAMMSNRLLLALYVPVGILGVIIGFIWFYIAYNLIKISGIKVKNY